MHEDCPDDCPGARRAYKEAARLVFNPGGVQAARIFKMRAEGHQGPAKKPSANNVDPELVAGIHDEYGWTETEIKKALAGEKGDEAELIRIVIGKLGKA